MWTIANLDDFSLLLEDGLHGGLVLRRKVEAILGQARGSLQPELNALPENEADLIFLLVLLLI